MTTPYRPSLWNRIRFKLAALPLPLKRKRFAGFDLDGNRFYESYNPLTPNKPRRTVVYKTEGHYTENNVTPQWMSWLRYTRQTAPTEEELLGEVRRIVQTRQNAQLVARRWQEEALRLASPEQTGGSSSNEPDDTQASTTGTTEKVTKREESQRSEWQPESWTPSKPAR